MVIGRLTLGLGMKRGRLQDLLPGRHTRPGHGPADGFWAFLANLDRPGYDTRDSNASFFCRTVPGWAFEDTARSMSRHG